MTDPTQATGAAAQQPAAKQKPSQGRTVLVRHGEKTHPGMIVDVRDDGSVDVQIFRADHMTHSAHALKEVGPELESGDGWLWPPRV